MHKKSGFAVQICHEVALHSELDHPNILPLYGAFMEDDDIFLVMPYAHQGSVYHLLQKETFPEEVLVAEIVLPFLAGLQYLHSKGYLHRDVKTENVLVDDSGRVMIADFGLAMDATACPAVHRVGTPVYMVRFALLSPMPVLLQYSAFFFWSLCLRVVYHRYAGCCSVLEGMVRRHS